MFGRVTHACDLPRAVIRFYSVSEDHGDFSNFARYPVRVGGKTYPTSEHYYQSQKFAGTPHADEVRRASSPGRAAAIGRSRARPLRRDWDSVKLDVMRVALRAKFEQHPHLREQLLATGDALLVEHTGRDAYWGDGGDGTGKNWLGRLLMELREQLAVSPR